MSEGSASEAKPVVLPVPGERNVLITSALPYVNNVPHLGNIIGCVLSADAFARYCRGRGYNTLYIGGTDEYGTATEAKARQDGVSPIEICDKYHAIHRQVYDWFGISFDYFGRTTTPQQTEITQDIFKKLYAKELFFQQGVDQLFCVQCNSVLADRFVEGECPKCGYGDARGDQCDSCQNLLNSTELINPRCKEKHEPREPLIVKTSNHLFLDLTKMQPTLENWFGKVTEEGTWTPNAKSVTGTWLKGGLLPRCLTRDLKWGVPVPLDGFEDKVFYVWFDAPIGYISITACYTDDWQKWWKDPENVQLYQFIGKDNVPFHCIMFPGCLLETGDNYTVLNHISATEYLNYDGDKFSKGRGIGVFGNQCWETTIPADIWRYYLFMIRPESSDSNFAWNDLEQKSNNELLANIGNLYNRLLQFAFTKFDKKVPQGSEESFTDLEKETIVEANVLLKHYIEVMEHMHLMEGLKTVLKISQLGNQYLQKSKVWELFKSDQKRCAEVVYFAVNFCYNLAAVLEPFLPFTAEKVCGILNAPKPKITDQLVFPLAPDHSINKPDILIPKLSHDYLESLDERFGGKKKVSGPAFPVDLRVGKIVEVNNHDDPANDTLYVLKVDVGEDQPRQVAAGLRKHYSAEELLNRMVVVVCNLKVAEIRGVTSQGMCLAAESKSKALGLLVPPEGKAPGSRVLPKDTVLQLPDHPLDLKAEFQKISLKTLNDPQGTAAFWPKGAKQGLPFLVDEEAVIATEKVGGNCKIK